MKNIFKDFFTEGDGNGSSIRLVFIVGCSAIFFVWAWLSIKNNTILSFELQDLGAIGLLIAGKEVQKYFETHKKS